MATQASTVEYITDQLSSASNIATRKMFGEYALYAGGKVVGLICDDTLYIKITLEGKDFIGDSYVEGTPYPGAKPWMQIDEDQIEDGKWLCELIEITVACSPEPKPRKKKLPLN